MTDPKETATEGQISPDNKNSDRRWIDEFKSREIVTVAKAQVIIAWDGFNLICEGPGANGSRQKIEGLSLDQLPEEIHSALIEQLDRLRAAKPAKPAPKAEYVDPQIAREIAAEAAGAARLKARQEWIDGLSEPKRSYEQEKFDKSRERAAENALNRARDIWTAVASDHGTELANRVISDPNRRPRKRVFISTSGGTKLMSPRTGKVSDTKLETGPKFKGDKNGTAVKIDL